MTKLMQRRIMIMLSKTWSAIGKETLSELDVRVANRRQVIHAVSDSALILLYGGKDIEAYREWEALPASVKKDLLWETFPFSTYEVK